MVDDDDDEPFDIMSLSPALSFLFLPRPKNQCNAVAGAFLVVEVSRGGTNAVEKGPLCRHTASRVKQKLFHCNILSLFLLSFGATGVSGGYPISVAEAKFVVVAKDTATRV